ncbi:MAG: MFS transporter [Planctomycetia bacterium]|nr:MFS transporter [Planctomycetia bacterium]
MKEEPKLRLFIGCFTALIATAFGFIVRAMIMNQWATQFGLSDTQKGEIFGVGLWPFAISIVLFSLVIDRIGYGKAMVFAFVCHVASAIVTICAPMVLAPAGSTEVQILAGQKAGYWMLYLGNFIVALGNGTVEAVVNPVVATMFAQRKTKWLNILHAGWPGGLVLGGLIAISMDPSGIIGQMAAGPIVWQWKVALIFIPVLIYGVLMLGCKFPVNERVAAGVSYRDMLKQIGGLGALIVLLLIFGEVFRVFGWNQYAGIGLAVLLAGAFGVYVQAVGRPMFIFLMIIMIPLATTELGTDSWITPLLNTEMKAIGLNAGWVLVYTSFIMMVLRFFAGPIVHKISPLGLLAVSSVVAGAGLFALSSTTGKVIFLAATLYGFGKTFFWPTMLGVVSEQFPKGGALTLNAIGGVGMLGVGVVGAAFTGFFQDKAMDRDLAAYDQKNKTELHQRFVTEKKESIFGTYQAIDQKAIQAATSLVAQADKTKEEVIAKLTKENKSAPTDAQVDAALKANADYQKLVGSAQYQQEIKISQGLDEVDAAAKKSALRITTCFPAFMFVCYMILIVYFRSKGGYHAEVLTGHGAKDDEYTGGVAGPVE